MTLPSLLFYMILNNSTINALNAGGTMPDLGITLLNPNTDSQNLIWFGICLRRTIELNPLFRLIYISSWKRPMFSFCSHMLSFTNHLELSFISWDQIAHLFVSMSVKYFVCFLNCKICIEMSVIDRCYKRNKFHITSFCPLWTTDNHDWLILAHGYSSESIQRELSNEYQHDRLYMVFKSLLPCTFNE